VDTETFAKNLHSAIILESCVTLTPVIGFFVLDAQHTTIDIKSRSKEVLQIVETALRLINMTISSKKIRLKFSLILIYSLAKTPGSQMIFYNLPLRSVRLGEILFWFAQKCG
jgi:hypothetical protein